MGLVEFQDNSNNNYPSQLNSPHLISVEKIFENLKRSLFVSNWGLEKGLVEINGLGQGRPIRAAAENLLDGT